MQGCVGFARRGDAVTALDKAGLVALAERVEALTGPCRETDAEIARAIGWYQKEVVCHGVKGGKWVEKYWTYKGDTRAAWSSVPPHDFTASLDVAMTLVPDGWAIEGLSFWPAAPDEADTKTQASATARLVGTSVRRMGRSMVWGHSGGDGRTEATASTPALALSAAALRAIAAGQP